MDDFIEEKFSQREAVWIVKLSNGELVYQDDYRSGEEPASAWLRLKQRCQRESLAIQQIGLKFRSNELWDIVPPNASAYFFSRSAVGIWGEAGTIQLYLIGAVEDGELIVKKWQIPELICVGVERRKIVSGDNLIEFPVR